MAEQPLRSTWEVQRPELRSSTVSAASPPAPTSRALLQLATEPADFDSLTQLEDQMRPSTDAKQQDPLSPFISPSQAAAAAGDPSPQPSGEPYGPYSYPPPPRLSGQRRCQGAALSAAAAAVVDLQAAGNTLLLAAGSGPSIRARQLASEDMPLSSSLSEPLLQSTSPATTPPPGPHQHPHPCSGSASTAVTANSGSTAATGDAAVSGQPSEEPVWTASAAPAAASTAALAATGGRVVRGTVAGGGQRASSSERVPAVPTPQERKPTLRPSGCVERSGGSRLGRPELAVVGPAAAAAAAVAEVPEPNAGSAAASEPPSAATAAEAAASGGVASSAVAHGGSRTGPLAMLNGMTRRLLIMVHDVGSAVSQVGLMPGVQRAEAAAAAAAAPAAGVGDDGDGGGGADAAVGQLSAVGRAAAGRTGAEAAAAAAGVSRAGPAGGGVEPSSGGWPEPPRQPQHQHQRHQHQQQPRTPQQEQDQQQNQRLAQSIPRPQRLTAGTMEQWAQHDAGVGDNLSTGAMTAAAVAASGGGGGGGGGGLYPPYIAARGSLRAGSDSGSAAVPRRNWEDVVHGGQHVAAPYSPQYNPLIPVSTGRTPRHARRDVSQVAMMQMLHFGSTSGRVPLQHLSTLNIANLSREIRALHWIGQGGGGAVFQGVWQGAPVAVKFMLAARPEHVDATALEGVVSLAVGHPNVVTTYSFEVTRLTETSFLPDAAMPYRHSQQPAAAAGCGGGGEDSSATALYNALMETDASLEPSAAGGGGGCRHTRHQLIADLGPSQRPGGGGGGGVNSRSASVQRVENLSMRVRRAQAAAALASGPTTPASAEAPSAAAPDGDGVGGGSGRVCAPAPAVPASQHVHHAHVPEEPLGIESAFNSEEGFGDPDLTDNGQSWTVRHVLSYLKALPGMYMTHIIMEYCDRGSLLAAIKRGVFRTDGLPEDEGSSGGGISSPGGSGGGGGGGHISAAGQVLPPPVVPEPPRITKRVVLRALLRTARDIAQGMCHLHSNGIIHGDLKPGNVLLRGCRSDRRGFTALVSDFGLSKVTRGDKPLELNHWSTVTVMAPEVIMGRWLKASDVFSFGILLWQLLTGEMMPYGNATVQQVLMGVAQGVLKPEWPASAHPALVRLGRACLANSPEKRPSFEAIVKILTKIEQCVRNELRAPRDVDPTAPWAPPGGNSSRYSRSSGSETTAMHLHRLRSSAM